MTEDTRETEVAQITVTSRIPDFWEDQPRTWFIQAESVLYNQKLSDAAKYHLVIAKLGKHVVQQVTDILVKPPAEGKYELLKTTLLAIYEESETRQIQKLMGEMELGDQKPSQLLRRMRELARDKVNNETLNILWQNHLPASVRAVLVVTDTKDLSILASIADKVMETISPVNVATVESRSSNYSIIAEIAKINKRLDQMSLSRSRSKSRNGRRMRSRSRVRRNHTPRRTKGADWLCFYHYRYKEKAHKCIQPCAWKEGESGN